MKSGALFWTIILCSLSLHSGCVGTVQRPSAPVFRDVYSRISDQATAAPTERETAERFSFSAQNAPLPALLRQIADRTSISVIAHSSLEKSLVSVEIKEAPVSEVLAAIARSLDRRLTRIGGIYFLGPVEPEDRGALVRRVRRCSAEELGKITDLFKSEHGRAYVSGDGLVVVADRVEVLERIAQTFDQVERAEVSSWVLQLVVVSLGDRTKTSLGITTDLTAKFAAQLATPSTSAADASLAFSSLLTSVHDSTDSRVVAQPLLVVRDGSKSVIRRGEDLRLPKRSTSPYGTSEVTGYEVVKTGLTIDATLRDDTTSNASLLLKLELSSISGYTDGLPIITTQGIESQTSLASGGVYLLGALEAGALARSLTGSPVPLLFGRDSSTSTLQVWAKAYRIAGSLSPAQQASAAAGNGGGSASAETPGPAARPADAFPGVRGAGWQLATPPAPPKAPDAAGALVAPPVATPAPVIPPARAAQP